MFFKFWILYILFHSIRGNAEKNHTLKIIQLDSELNHRWNLNLNSSIIYFINYNYTVKMNNIIQASTRLLTDNIPFPVFFTAMQDENIVNWKLPYNKSMAVHRSLNRTICFTKEKGTHHSIHIEISTSSPGNVTIELNTTYWNYHYNLGESMEFEASTADDRFYLIVDSKIPMNLSDRFMLDFTSPTSSCSTIYLFSSKTHCPTLIGDTNHLLFIDKLSMTKVATINLKHTAIRNAYYFFKVSVENTGKPCKVLTDIYSGRSRGEIKKSITVQTHSGESEGVILLSILLPLCLIFILYISQILIVLSPAMKHKLFPYSVDVDNLVLEEENKTVDENGYTHLIDNDNVSYERDNNNSEEDDKLLQLSPEHSNILNLSEDENLLDLPINEATNEKKLLLNIPKEDENEGDHLLINAIQPYNTSNVNDNQLFLPDNASINSDILSHSHHYLSGIEIENVKADQISYPKLLFSISIFYSLPSLQLVLNYEWFRNSNGNNDACYYNFRCLLPAGQITSFNRLYSNIGYILLGILFFLIVHMRERIKQNSPYSFNESRTGTLQQRGMFYAMAISLIAQGFLSAFYHICPNYDNFQFDTSFMYTMAVLIILQLFQNRHPKMRLTSNSLVLLVATIIGIVVCGVFFNSYLIFWIVYGISHNIISSVVCALLWNGGNLNFNCIDVNKINIIKTKLERRVLCFLIFIVNFVISMVGYQVKPPFSTLMVSIMMTNVLLYFLYYLIMKRVICKEKVRLLPALCLLLSVIIWFVASYYYFDQSTSWEESPAISRERNRFCISHTIFDAHDIWHFLSALAMFLLFMCLLTIDDDLLNVPKTRIRVF
ncbi:hypothetical protein SNEBB_009598 [Seison nebaliae]|nr:hypothetical protein SNEBB_009598 [Seison nebaliae]